MKRLSLTLASAVAVALSTASVARSRGIFTLHPDCYKTSRSKWGCDLEGFSGRPNYYCTVNVSGGHIYVGRIHR